MRKRDYYKFLNYRSAQGNGYKGEYDKDGGTCIYMDCALLLMHDKLEYSNPKTNIVKETELLKKLVSDMRNVIEFNKELKETKTVINTDNFEYLAKGSKGDKKRSIKILNGCYNIELLNILLQCLKDEIVTVFNFEMHSGIYALIGVNEVNDMFLVLPTNAINPVIDNNIFCEV